MTFNDYYWHDAILKNINIDRSNPGIADVIDFEIIWPDGKCCKIYFKDVYFARFTLNMGIVASESILDAYITDEKDEDIIEFYSSWKGLFKNLNLSAFVFNLNSTGSSIKIIAKELHIIDI